MKHSPVDNSGLKKQKRYATVLVLLSGGIIGGSTLAAYNQPQNYGVPISYRGGQYYIPGDSRRAIYPSREACLRDVPPDRQAECEPTRNYYAATRLPGSWYGPVYNPRDSYKPSSRYKTEAASQANVGKQFPSGANSTGFGASGKALTSSGGS